MEQTLGQLIKWDFKANGALEIKDKNVEEDTTKRVKMGNGQNLNMMAKAIEFTIVIQMDFGKSVNGILKAI